MLNNNLPPKYEAVDISTPQKFNAYVKKYEINSTAPEPVNYQNNNNSTNQNNGNNYSY